MIPNTFTAQEGVSRTMVSNRSSTQEDLSQRIDSSTSSTQELVSRSMNEKRAQGLEASDGFDVEDKQRTRLRNTKHTWAFGLLGLLIGLSATVTATAASAMFHGITGVFEVSNSVVAVVASFATPFIQEYISYRGSMIICALSTMLSYAICALPDPLSKEPASNAGPLIGTMITGFLHAFGSASLLSLAAFYPEEAPLALSVGQGLAVIVGPGVLIGLLDALKQAWRLALLIFMVTGPMIMLVWWLLVDQACLDAAEKSRIAPKEGSKAREECPACRMTQPTTAPVGESSKPRHNKICPKLLPRTRLLWKIIFRHHLLAFLVLCVAVNVATMGIAPTLQNLKRLEGVPKGNLQFELVFLASGVGNALASVIAGYWPKKCQWIWTGLAATLCMIGLVQIWFPFLKFFGVWAAIMFLLGAFVGVGRTNCFFALEEGFKGDEYDKETRAFAMGFGTAGNFLGDAVGGGFAVMIERLATQNMTPTKWPKVL